MSENNPMSLVPQDAVAPLGERVLGLNEDVRFEDATSRALSKEAAEVGTSYTISVDEVESRRRVLQGQGVAVEPSAAPHHHWMEQIGQRGWERIRNAEQPLVDLYAASNYLKQVSITETTHPGTYERLHPDPRKGPKGLENRAMMESLPLIHGMSADSFVLMAEKGVMQSNKELYRQSGKEALDFHSAGAGATNLQDRMLGLDQYVFFDFGRPAINHKRQPEITLVVDQAAMYQPSSIMTDRDIADAPSVTNYMNGITTPEHFRETVLMRIHNSVIGEVREGRVTHTVYNTLSKWIHGEDGDFNREGYPEFSTYEVKIPFPPGVQTEAISHVIVRDEETHRRLQETMGDRFTFVYEPDLHAAGRPNPDYEGDARDLFVYGNGNYPERLTIPGAFEKRLEALIDAEYNERALMLAALPEDEKEQALVVFGGSDPAVINAEDVRMRINSKTNPYLYHSVDGFATYDTADQMRADIQNTTDYYFQLSTSQGHDPWFYDPFSGNKGVQTPSGACVLAVIERSKTDPQLCKIVNLQTLRLEDVESAASQAA